MENLEMGIVERLLEKFKIRCKIIRLNNDPNALVELVEFVIKNADRTTKKHTLKKT